MSTSALLPTVSTIPSQDKVQKQDMEQKIKRAQNDAAEYTKFLFSTFAKVMLETLEESENTEENMTRTSFLADALGESLALSPAGEQIKEDMLKSILSLLGQESDKKLTPYPSSFPYDSPSQSTQNKEASHVAFAA